MESWSVVPPPRKGVRPGFVLASDAVTCRLFQLLVFNNRLDGCDNLQPFTVTFNLPTVAFGADLGLIRGFQTLPSAPQSWDRSLCRSWARGLLADGVCRQRRGGMLGVGEMQAD